MKVGDLIIVIKTSFVPLQLKGRYGVIVSISDQPDTHYAVIVQGRPDLPYVFFDDEIMLAPLDSDDSEKNS